MTNHQLHQKAGIGPCMDVRGYDGRIYAIQHQNGGRLAVLTPDLKLLCTYEGIGNARQIEIKDGVAAVSAREDGLWLFDLREEQPRLLSHYRTVEFATGITMYKNLVFVSCRQYGVEVVDISDPAAPRYAGVIRMGEAQSACVYNDVLYGGVWGTMEVVAVDISDMRNPRPLGRLPLSGRGDGVVVRDGLLYAATGQHRRGIQNATDSADPLFGMGNGVEIYDVHDPAHPRHLAWHFFEKGHAISFDMWKPMLCGDLLLCNNSVLGVFGYDIRTMERRFRILPPAINGQPDPVTGTVVHGGKLYISTGLGDLFLFDEFPLVDTYRHDAKGCVATAIEPLTCPPNGQIIPKPLYIGQFPILAVDVMKRHSLLALSCGEQGIQLIDPESHTPVAAYKTDGFCYDIKCADNLLCAALGERGVGIFRYECNTLFSLSTLHLEASVQQLALSENGQFVAAICGGQCVKMIDLRDPAHPAVIYEYTDNAGLLYGENFLTHPYGGRGISLFWHRVGLVYSDPEGGDRAFHVLHWSMKNGFTGYCPGNGCDTDGDRILFARRGGYTLLPPQGGSADDLPLYRTEQKVHGKFCIAGHHLIVTERAEGIVSVLDIADIAHPRLLGKLHTNTTPSKAVETPWGILIAGRYQGLLKLTLERGTTC